MARVGRDEPAVGRLIDQGYVVRRCGMLGL